MARLPQVGSDDGTWGQILNEYLAQAHDSDGTLKAGSVTEGMLATAVQTKLNAAGGSSTPADGSVTTAKLANGAVTNAKVAIDKTAVGLANVDNTSDAGKPVSTATQTALNAKEPTVTAGTSSQYYRGDKTWVTLDKTAAGLGNVDNTSDANKPLSTATAAALSSRPNFVFVVTGSEARPTGTTNVVWVGGSTRPTNTVAGDLWLSE